jgi:hypothetical protein
MLRVPGVASGHVYSLHPTARPQQDKRWAHAARFELLKPAEEVMVDVRKRLGTPDMPGTDALDPALTVLLAATPLRPRVEVAKPRGGTLLQVVLTNARPGQDEVFNTWYNERHIPDVLTVPGFLAAQRFKVASLSPAKPSPWAYLALYEVAAEMAAESQAELSVRAGGPKMPLSETLERETTYVSVFRMLA